MRARDVMTEDVVTVHSEEERRALHIAAENIPGVRGVEVHLSLVPIWSWGE